MNKSQLICSLVRPAIAVCSGIFWIMLFWIISGNIFSGGMFNTAIPMICGGIISAFLTVKFNVDTSRYFKINIIFPIISFFTFTIPAIMILCFYSNLTGYIFDYMIISSCITLLSEIICFVKLHIKIKDFAVMILSDVLARDLVMLVIILFIAMNNI